MSLKKGLSLGIDARTLGATGIGRYVTELMAAMAPEHPESRFHLFVRRDSTDLFDSRLSALSNVSTYTTAANYYSLHEQLRYGRQLDGFRFDAIHFPNFNTPRYINTPFVATIHDLILLRFPGRVMWPGKRLLYRFVLNRTIRQARTIITISDWSRRDIIAYAEDIGVTNATEKVVAIPIGLGEHFWQQPTKDEVRAALLDLNIVNPYFLCVGAQLKHKNIHRVVAAFAELRRDAKYSHFKLVIAGRRTEPASHLDEALHRHAGAAEDIIFTGTVTDATLRALYHGATALVFASEIEGFGLPILEAQACGTPVITGNTTAMPETAGGAALLVRATDEAAIGRAMRRVINHKYPADMIKRGRENARGFSWQRCAEQTYDIYRHAARQK